MLDARQSKFFQLVIAITAAVGLLFQHDLIGGILILLLPLGYLALVAAACLLALDAIIAKLRRRPSGHLVSALLLALALGPALPWVYIPFCWVSAAHKLWRNESSYIEVVRRTDAGEPAPSRTHDVLDPAWHGAGAPEIYLTDEGPPLRYSFAWGGIADNWCGVVHDRSKTFADAPADVFGGMLVLQLHLWGPWYYVQFT